MTKQRIFSALALLLVLALFLVPGQAAKKNKPTATPVPTATPAATAHVLTPQQRMAQEVADYLFTYGCLPDRFITKRQAQALGWDSMRNLVSDVAPGKAIGGDRFGNYEGRLPDAPGRTWYECDCAYVSGKRDAYRVLYSSDGLVYYTGDHYETFTQLFPSEESAAAVPLTDPQAVADYIFENGRLPENFITKKQAQALGWDASRNYLSDVAPGCSLGGDSFGNREKLLPGAKGRQYYECDVNYAGGRRGDERLVYSNDGLVFYSSDRFRTFTQLQPSH